MAHDAQQPSATQQVGTGAGDVVRLLPALLLIIVLIVFALANTQNVRVDLLVGDEKELPLILVMLISAVVGVIVTGLIKFTRRH